MNTREKIIYDEKWIVQVAIPIPTSLSKSDAYDYLYVKNTNNLIGKIVKVPFGQKNLWGIVLGNDQNTKIPKTKLKKIIEISDLPNITAETLVFLKKVSKWTLTPYGSIIKLLLCLDNAYNYKKTQKIFFNGDIQNIRGKKQKEIVNLLKKHSFLDSGKIKKLSGVSTTTISKLEKEKKILFKFEKISEQENLIPSKKFLIANRKLKLNKNQVQIAKNIFSINKQSFCVHLLDGVTGSGKTEVYFELIFKKILENKQCLILLPEIALTQDWKLRFKKWFNFEPFIWHSSVTNSEKVKIWRHASKGNTIVVAGARSALFLPFAKLGLIIVDEEHDISYKQEEKVIYHARDMAILRAKIQNIPIVLASATPSLDSWINAGVCEYEEIKILKKKDWYYWKLEQRYGNAKLPEISLIDLRKSKPSKNCWLAPEIVDNLSKNLRKKEQSLLFLNRRGYAPMTFCEECGHKISCNHCDTLLVHHKFKKLNLCHYCGKSQQIFERCPKCNAHQSLRSIGPGVERLKEEVLTNFPKSKVAIFSSDLIKNSKDLEDLYNSIRNEEVQILIGTQMVAKGHDFPNLTFVGVVDVDFGFNGGDLRAAERTFQLLVQVAGRAGRSIKKGKVLIQTMQVEHPAIKAINFDKKNFVDSSINFNLSNARDNFFLNEALLRREAGMPPFGNLAAVTIKSKKIKLLNEFVNLVNKKKPIYKNVEILGPAKPPLEKIRDNFRYRFLIKSKKNVDIQKIIFEWFNEIKVPSGIRIVSDIDPHNFL